MCVTLIKSLIYELYYEVVNVVQFVSLYKRSLWKYQMLHLDSQ